jgi:hypothetical protein
MSTVAGRMALQLLCTFASQPTEPSTASLLKPPWVEMGDTTMRLIAHITYPGGALVLPAHDPYDRQLVLQQAEACARRYGAVGLEVGGKQVRIHRTVADSACDICARPCAALSFAMDGRRLCTRCVRQRIDGVIARSSEEIRQAIARPAAKPAKLLRARWRWWPSGAPQRVSSLRG